MIDRNIGSAKDNMNSAIHNWYKFTAGFSYKFVDVIVDGLAKRPSCIYEPFAGCGTTLVEAQKMGINSIGNESQRLMCDIINAKLNWEIDENLLNYCLSDIETHCCSKKVYNHPTLIHPLLYTLFDEESLQAVAEVVHRVHLTCMTTLRERSIFLTLPILHSIC